MKASLRAQRLVSAARSTVAFSALVLLPACQAMPAADAVTVIASQPAGCGHTGASGGGGPSGTAFLAAADWQVHLDGGDAALRAALSSWRVDFARGQSVVLVRVGPQPNPGYRVTVEQEILPVKARTVQAIAVVHPPPGNRMQAQVIAYPCVYLKLEGAPYRKVAVELERRPGS